MTYFFIEQQKQLSIVYTIQQHVTKVSRIDKFELKAGDF